MLETIGGQWYQSDVLWALLSAAVATFFFGSFYPMSFEDKRINNQLEKAFLAFNFLLFGATIFVLIGLTRSEGAAGVMGAVLAILAAFGLRAGYRAFLAREDADWWLEKTLEEFRKKNTAKSDGSN